MRRILVIALLTVAFGSLAHGATYYVDSAMGADDLGRGGGPGDPWRTINYAFSRITGVNTIVCRGNFVEDIALPEDDGGSTLRGVDSTALTGAVTTYNQRDWTFIGFDLYGSFGCAADASNFVNKCRFENPTGTALYDSG